MLWIFMYNLVHKPGSSDIYTILFYFDTIGKGIIPTPGNDLTYFTLYFFKKVRHTHTPL